MLKKITKNIVKSYFNGLFYGLPLLYFVLLIFRPENVDFNSMNGNQVFLINILIIVWGWLLLDRIVPDTIFDELANIVKGSKNGNISNEKADRIGFGSKNFLIYTNPSGITEVIKNGWSWPGFIFTFLWLAYKGMIIWSICGFAFVIVISFLGVPEYYITILSIGFGVYCGSNGNSLYRKYLEQKGYNLSLSVNADNPQNAKAQFVEYMQITN